MTKITKKHLTIQLNLLNAKFGQGDRFRLDHFSMGWRLEDGPYYVSPRLSTREMYYWMEGFTTGVEITKREWRIQS